MSMRTVLAVDHSIVAIAKNPEVRKYLHDKIKELIEHDLGFKLLMDRMAHRYNVTTEEASRSALVALIDPETLKD